MKNRYTFFFIFLLLQCIADNVAAQLKGWDTCQNTGLGVPPYTRLDDIYFFNKDTGVVVTSYGQILKTPNGGTNWYLRLLSPSSATYFRSLEFTDNHQVGIAGALDGHIFRSQDKGEAWTDISFNVPDTGATLRRICGLAHWGNNNFYGVGWWGGTTARFYKSADAGNTWNVSYIDTNLASGLVDIICLSADTIFASGCRLYQNGTKRESVVLRSINGGQNWTKVFADTTIGGRIWKLQAIDHQYIIGSIEPEYSDTVAMIRSTNSGSSWQIIGAGHMPSLGWGTQGIGFMNRQKGWLGGYYDGLFETTDGGVSWSLVFNNASWANRFFKADDTTMYLSGASVYKYADSAHKPGVGIAQPATTFRHTLYPVSPNPASGMVTITFDLKGTTNTLVEVVNTDGRSIYPVMNGYLKPGHYSYTWDGSGQPAGNYIIWLGTDETPMVQKFTLR